MHFKFVVPDKLIPNLFVMYLQNIFDFCVIYYVRHECFFVEIQPHVTTLMLWLQLDMEFGVAKVDYILAPPWLHEFVKYFACIGE